jgi:hypothetical protein
VINQLDNAEKAAQVCRMRDIYTQAANTLVWLGLAADESDATIHFLKRLEHTLNKGVGFICSGSSQTMRKSAAQMGLLLLIPKSKFSSFWLSSSSLHLFGDFPIEAIRAFLNRKIGSVCGQCKRLSCPQAWSWCAVESTFPSRSFKAQFYRCHCL